METDVLKNRQSRWLTNRHTISAITLSLIVWIIAYALSVQDRQNKFSETAQQARQIAVFFERHVVGIFQYGDTYLKLVRREYLKENDLDSVRNLLSEAPLNKSIASHVTIMDEYGTPLLVSGHEIKPGSTAKDREYFIFQKNTAGDDLLISQPHKGRNSGKLIVRMVRRYDKPNGDFGGVIFIALEAEHITRFFNSMKIGPRSSATLVGEDKNIRARSSYGRLGPGQNISGSRIWKELAISPTGLYRQVSVVDDITRYYAYRRVPDFPLVVAIGMSVDDLSLSSAWSQLYDYAVALLATLSIIITAVFLHRQQLLLKQIELKNVELDNRNKEIQSQNSELENKNAELERFTYTVSHDLKSPLVTIKGFLGLLQKDMSDQNQDAVTRDMDQISNAAEKMGQLLTELLELSHVGRQMRAPKLVNLNELVNEAISRLSIQSEMQGQDIDINPNIPDVYGDPGRLLEVYQNLITNALKFMGDQAAPHLEIGAQRQGNEVRCFVRDNGIGISPEYHERIFELFDRLDTQVEGTGIGLALVKRIVEVHGGRIWVESRGAGQGSTFWFTLPATQG